MHDATSVSVAGVRERASPGERLFANLGMLVTVSAWGSFFPVLERLLQNWDPFSATVGRQIVGATFLIALVVANRRRVPLPRVVSWRRILLLGGVGVSFGSLITSIGVAYSSGLSSAIISTTNPVSAALTAALLYREPLGRAVILGTLLSVVGGLVSVPGRKRQATHGSRAARC